MTTKNVPERLCIFCTQWRFDGGSEAYSDVTLGCSASVECRKNHWPEYNLHAFNNENDFRQALLRASTCIDYSPPMTEAQKLILIDIGEKMSQVASNVGAMHSWWDTIFYIRGIVSGKNPPSDKTVDGFIADCNRMLEEKMP